MRKILFVWVLLMPLMAKAQIRGTVCDENQQPISFANVSLLGTDSIFIEGSTTDEEGMFTFNHVAPSAAIWVKVSAIGYKTTVKPLENNGNMGTLILPMENVLLNEVTVKGQHPTHKLSKGGVVTTIHGSVLELLGNTLDVIEQLPGVRREGDEISIFGKGTPAIYINGRKLSDYNELYRLSPKEIESIEVINNPGAKYEAEVKSVLLIRTVKKQGEGWSGTSQAVVRTAHSWSQSDDLSVNYRKGNLDVFSAFSFDYAQRYQQQRNTTTIQTKDDSYLLTSDISILPQSTSYTFNCGFNWQINPKHVFGAKYEFQSTPRNPSDWNTHESVVLNGTPVDNIDYQTRWERKNTPLNILNIYYIGEYGNWRFTLNNDYYSSRSRAAQEIDEVSVSEGEATINSLNHVKSTMLASKGVLEYAFGKNSIEGGYEYTHTNRTDLYYNYGDFLPDADDNIKEKNLAGFVSVTFPIGAYELSGGIRYEHSVSDYYQDNVWIAEQSRKYNRLFPNLNFTFPIKQAKFTLSYTAKTRRPLYSQLSSNIQYDDRFTYETGNPLLQPEINHDITLAGIYKWIFFSASYQYIEDAIMGIVEPYQEGEPINLMTYLNYGHLSKYDVVLFLSPRISKWSPRLQLNLMGQDLKLPVMDREKRMTNPLVFGSFYNSISIGKGFTVTGDITCHTSGDMDVVTLKPSWQIDLGMTKTQGDWYFQLSATDIFKTARNSMITYGTQMKLDKWNYSDSQAIRLTIRYSFNATMDRYKGRGAGQSERNRL